MLLLPQNQHRVLCPGGVEVYAPVQPKQRGYDRPREICCRNFYPASGIILSMV